MAEIREFQRDESKSSGYRDRPEGRSSTTTELSASFQLRSRIQLRIYYGRLGIVNLPPVLHTLRT